MPQQNRFRLRRRALSGFVLLGTLALGAIPALAAGGPDVTVFTLGSTTRWGQVGNIIGYSVGTTSCNIGTTPVAWCDAGTCLGGTLQSNDHPVIAQNMYRLKDGRFTQIGMSWLKHGWLSTNSGGSNSGCGVGVCTIPPGGGDQLGVGCTDTYDSSLNGGSGNPGTCDSGSCRLGQRSAVNATTGDFLMPYVNIAHPATIDQRLQVNVNDVDPGLAANIGALYFVEGQYIGGDDGAAGNAFNNASYRPVTIGASPFNLSLAGSTVRLKSALYGWLANDPQPDPDPDPNDGVVITNQDFCVSPVERFEVGRKVTGPIAGVWHYEYAVHNMNSDHSAGSFSVDFPDGTAITNVGFHDVDSHSGEPYATTEWTSAVDAGTGTVSWTSETYATNNNANALRFATMYSFWFDATAPGSSATHSIGLFKPVAPAVVDAGSDVAICAGASVQIGTAAIGGQNYSWSPGGATTAQITVSPSVQTIYTVTAVNNCANASDSVTVSITPGADAPALVAPADGAINQALPVALSWAPVAGATTYTLEVATDAAFASIVHSETIGGTSTSVAGLDPIEYFWRVRATNVCIGAPSATRTFTVTDVLFTDGFESGGTSAWSVFP